MKLFGSEKTPEEKLTTDLIGNFWYPGRFPPEFNRLERKRVYYAVEDAFKRGKSCDEIQKAYDDIISEVKDERKVSKENEISNNSIDPNVIQYNDEFQQIIAEGWLTCFLMPEFETVSHGGGTKGIATGAGVVFGGLVGGLIGYALSSGSKTQQIEINTTARVVEKGIVIAQASPSGGDLRIPWENILSAFKCDYNSALMYIKLVNGEEVRISSPHTSGLLFIRRYTDEFINYINERACGQVEDGW